MGEKNNDSENRNAEFTVMGYKVVTVVRTHVFSFGEKWEMEMRMDGDVI